MIWRRRISQRSAGNRAHSEKHEQLFAVIFVVYSNNFSIISPCRFFFPCFCCYFKDVNIKTGTSPSPPLMMSPEQKNGGKRLILLIAFSLWRAVRQSRNRPQDQLLFLRGGVFNFHSGLIKKNKKKNSVWFVAAPVWMKSSSRPRQQLQLFAFK